MGRVRYVVHGRGLGHATRALALMNHLRAAGHEVIVAGGRDALAVLRAQGPVEEAPSLTPGMGLLATLSGLATRVFAERRALSRDDIALVISDGDLPALLGAATKRLPSIAIGHGLVFSHARRPEAVDPARWAREARKARLASLTSKRQIAVNFAPLEPAMPSATVARPELRPGLEREAPGPQGRIIAYFRDDNGAEVLSALVAQGERPLLFSDKSEAPGGVEVVKRDPEAFQGALQKARAVVSSAGSQLISECAHLGIPHFALHDENDDEQALNVQMLAQDPRGAGSSFRAFDPDNLRDLLERSEGSGATETRPWGPGAGQALLEAVDALIV